LNGNDNLILTKKYKKILALLNHFEPIHGRQTSLPPAFSIMPHHPERSFVKEAKARIPNAIVENNQREMVQVKFQRHCDSK